MVKGIDIVSIKLVKNGEFQYESREAVDSPKAAVHILQQFIGDRDREYMVALHVDTKTQFNSISVVSIGSLNQAIVHPREVFKAAILSNAASVLVAHNHPSGVDTPSIEDINITNRLNEAGKILGIELLDHIVITGDSYYSFREHNLI